MKSLPVLLPTGKEWLYAAKTFAAAMLALGIGFATNLDRPYWALATVYIASHPFAGPTRSKALYRLLGTLTGAAATIVLVPNLADAPPLLAGALAGWICLCLTLSLRDRTPRGYAFMLAGYTAAIIGFPAVNAPAAIWDTAVARGEEIGLGIVCATIVSTVVFPRYVGPLVLQRAAAWVRDGRRWAADVLDWVDDLEPARADRQRLLADAHELGVLAAQLPYEVGDHGISERGVRALHARLLMLLPVLSSISDRMRALRRAGGIPTDLAALLAEIAAWLTAAGGAAQGARLRDAVQRAQDAADHKGAGWAGIMRVGLLARLGELLALLQDMRELEAHLRAGRGGLPVLSASEVPSAQAHADMPMAAWSGVSAGLATLLICALWIASGWADGAVAAEMAAIGCCFFAAHDDPALAMLDFLKYAVIALAVDAVYLFAILPAIDGFPMLVAALAPTFLLFGVLAARPATAGAGMALAANCATLMALQGSYAADFAAFSNMALATITGLGAAAILTRLVRSVGTDWSAWRLVRSNWRSLAQAARRRGQGDRAAVAGLMLDRIGLVATRLGKLPAHLAPDIALLHGDLRVGFNIVELRRARHGLPGAAVQAIDATLDALARHYATLAGARALRHVPAPDAALRRRLDDALAAVAAAPAGGPRRDALLGLAGIRLVLFTGAPPGEPSAFHLHLWQREAA